MICLYCKTNLREYSLEVSADNKKTSYYRCANCKVKYLNENGILIKKIMSCWIKDELMFVTIDYIINRSIINGRKKNIIIDNIVDATPLNIKNKISLYITFS